MADDCRLTCGQLPSTIPLHPDIRESPTHRLAGQGSLVTGLDRLQAHQDGRISVNQDRLNFPFESGVVEDAGPDQPHDLLLPFQNLVVRCVDGEVLRPGTFHSAQVAREDGGLFRLVHLAYLLLGRVIGPRRMAQENSRQGDAC